jgi:hypothetical protein
MNPAKVSALLDTLKAACSRQFRFNPRRVAAGMRYVGTEGHGAAMVHVFRDSHTHSQIELKSTMATLREHHGESALDRGREARYRHTDAEIDAEVAARQTTLDYTRLHSCTGITEQLLAHCKLADLPAGRRHGARDGAGADRRAGRCRRCAPRRSSPKNAPGTPIELAHLLLRRVTW